jgi:hypothetical protein
MTSTHNISDINITTTKGEGRYRIAVNGIDAAWTYKKADGTWSVRTKDSGDHYNRNNEVVAGAETRKEALSSFAFWLTREPFFLAYRQERIEADAREMAAFEKMMNA